MGLRPCWVEGPWDPLRSPGGIGEPQLEGVNVGAEVDIVVVDIVVKTVDEALEEGELEAELLLFFEGGLLPLPQIEKSKSSAL